MENELRLSNLSTEPPAPPIPPPPAPTPTGSGSSEGWGPEGPTYGH